MCLFVFLVVCATRIINEVIVTSLSREVKNMCFRVIHLGKKGWQLYDLETHEFFVSRDAKFHEKVFPYANASSDSLLSHKCLIGMDEGVRGGDDEIDYWHLGVRECNVVEE